METRTLKYIAECCETTCAELGQAIAVTRVCTDSRTVQAGDLFIALRGDRFDGHDYLPEVIRRGAAAIIVECGQRPAPIGPCPVIQVPNTRQALGQIAARYRRDFKVPMVAVGGSNGKTTTKDLIASVLSRQFNTLRSEASFNNEIGVPLTLLALSAAHQAAVLEVGTNHPGELAPLLQMMEPELGVVTSIGREHLEFFGGLEGVIEEEGKLAEQLPARGVLFVNGDNSAMNPIVARTRAKVVRTGLQATNDWQGGAVTVTATGTAFKVNAPDLAWSGRYALKLLGRHQVLNALLAIAVGAHFGLTREQIHAGLARCSSPKMRLQLWQARGVQVLDDTYNANADSMLAALATLRELPCAGRRIAILGDMAEQGNHSQSIHAEVGEYVAQSDVQALFAVGQWAGVLAAAARAGGVREVKEYPTVETALEPIKEFVKPGDLVLLKASRAAHFERFETFWRKND